MISRLALAGGAGDRKGARALPTSSGSPSCCRVWEWTKSDLVELPALRRLVLGGLAFQQSLHTRLESGNTCFVKRVDLPALETIELGEMALQGREEEDCSLVVRSESCCADSS